MGNGGGSYGVVIMYNIIGICMFCKSVANRHSWLTYNGGLVAIITGFTITYGTIKCI